MEVEEDEIDSHHQSPSPSRSQSPTSSQSPPPQSPNQPPPPHSPPSQQPEQLTEPPLSPSPISSIQPHQNQKQEQEQEDDEPEPEDEDVEEEEEEPEEAAQTLTLALPIQPPPLQTATTTPTPTHHSHGREDCWSDGATSTLIDAWGERYLELSRGNLKQKHWKDVADIVTGRDDYSKSSKTDVQCKNRIDTLKKKYKIEKNKMAESGFASKWSFFERLDLLIGTNSVAGSNNKNANTPSSSAPAPLQFQQLSGGGGGGGGKVPLAVPVHLVGRYDHASQTLNLNLNHQQQQHYQQQRPQRGQPEKTTKYMIESDESSGEPVYEDDSPDSTDSLPPETDYVRKRPRLFARRACPNPSANSVPVRGGSGSRGSGGVSYRGRARSSGKKRSVSSSSGGGGSSNWKSSIMELTKAIAKFGEAYEQIETSKLQQVVEMEQQRMEFMKELELQRMQFFMKTQVDLSQVKQGRRGGNSRRHNNNNNNNHSNNNINNGDDNSG